MLLRLLYLALTSVFTLIRLIPMTDSDKNVEILTLRHQLAILVAPPTVWEILKDTGIDPVPQPDHQTRTTFLRSQAHAILAADFIETRTLTGARLYVFAVIEHTTRSVRILGATDHPTATWTTQLARNLVMDLQDTDATAKHLIHDRYNKYPPHSTRPSTTKASPP